MRIYPDLLSCTAFLGVLQEGRHKSPEDQALNFYGTGFFVTLPTRHISSLTYFVTAKHVVDQIIHRKDAFLRANRHDGHADYILLEDGVWHCHPDDVHNDIAVIAAPIDFRRLSTTSIHPRHFMNENDTLNGNIGVGDTVHAVGLFSVHEGAQQNSPLVRSGTIAMLPKDKVLAGPQKRPIDAYLIEATSTNGMSGAPVFVELDNAHGTNAQNTNKLALLGMLHGHWDLPTKAIVADNTETKIPQNVGISIVIPAHKIRETLEQQAVLDEQDALFADAEAANERRFYDSGH